MKLLLVVSDGVGVRNFIHGRFLKVLRRFNIFFNIYSGVPAEPLRIAAEDRLDGIDVFEMPVYEPSLQEQLLRKAMEIAHLKHFKTFGMSSVSKRNTPKGISRRAFFNRAAYNIGRLCQSNKGIQLLNYLHEKKSRSHALTEQYRRLLKESKPDIIFFTHQRPPQSVPIVVAAKSLHIPTVAFIFSWDNLASKGRMPVTFDYYLVWSDHMKKDLLRYYPDIDETRIYIVGTLQFEPYVYDEFGWTEERFCEENGLTLGLARICFSGGNKTVGPNDPEYVRIIAEANRMKRFIRPIEIIVRPSPAEEDDRYQQVCRDFPEIKRCAPRWQQTRPDHPEPWSQRIPHASDIDQLKSTIKYSAINVNVASTMTLDFFHSNKPVVNVGFGGCGEFASWPDDSHYYQFEHYRPVLELKSAKLAKTQEELVNAINDYLMDPQLDSLGREALLKIQISVPLRGTSERIAQSLLDIVHAHKSKRQGIAL